MVSVRAVVCPNVAKVVALIVVRAWKASMYKTRWLITHTTPSGTGWNFHALYMFQLLFLIMFTLGGISGVILGNTMVDIALHDTYYVVAHFHFVLSLGAIIAFIVGFLHFIDCITSVCNWTLISSISKNLRIVYILIVLGVSLTFIPLHILGFNVMPRRIPDYPDYLTSWNLLSSLGFGFTLLGLMIVLHPVCK